jgi:hypothetical protein
MGTQPLAHSHCAAHKTQPAEVGLLGALSETSARLGRTLLRQLRALGSGILGGARLAGSSVARIGAGAAGPLVARMHPHFGAKLALSGNSFRLLLLQRLDGELLLLTLRSSGLDLLFERFDLRLIFLAFGFGLLILRVAFLPALESRFFSFPFLFQPCCLAALNLSEGFLLALPLGLRLLRLQTQVIEFLLLLVPFGLSLLFLDLTLPAALRALGFCLFRLCSQCLKLPLQLCSFELAFLFVLGGSGILNLLLALFLDGLSRVVYRVLLIRQLRRGLLKLRWRRSGLRLRLT